MIDSFSPRSKASVGDAQSDIFGGATITVMVMFIGLALALILFIILLQTAANDLREKKQELETEQAARVAAEADLSEEQKRAEELANQADKNAAQARASAQKAEKARRAAEEAAGRALSDNEISALADLPIMREKLRQAQEDNKEAYAEIARLARELSDKDADLRAALSSLREEQRQSDRLEGELAQCTMRAGGTQGGNMVNSGLRLWIDDVRGGAVITEATMREDQTWRQLYRCVADRKFLESGGGGGYRDGGQIGH